MTKEEFQAKYGFDVGVPIADQVVSLPLLQQAITDLGRCHGLNASEAWLFYRYITFRDYDRWHSIAYLHVWADRFVAGDEWNRSDYAGRRVLRDINRDLYPKDLDATFNRKEKHYV